MPARWYRSRFFWFGLPGFVFLLGWWLGSAGTLTRIKGAVRRGAQVHIMAWGGGMVGFCTSTERVMPMKPPPWIHADSIRFVSRHGPGFHHSTEPLGGQDPWQVFKTEHLHGKPAPALLLDLRLLAGIYGVSWLGGLVWWQRRKRLLAPHPGLHASRTHILENLSNR